MDTGASGSGAVNRSRKRLLAVARLLMDAHGLEGWELRWDKLGCRGVCDDDERTVILDWRTARRDTTGEFIDTVLHEIAHALVRTREAPHGPAWRRMARRLGCKPRA